MQMRIEKWSLYHGYYPHLVNSMFSHAQSFETRRDETSLIHLSDLNQLAEAARQNLGDTHSRALVEYFAFIGLDVDSYEIYSGDFSEKTIERHAFCRQTLLDGIECLKRKHGYDEGFNDWLSSVSLMAVREGLIDSVTLN